MPQQAKKGVGVYQNACFQGKKRRKIHIHQRAFKVFVGDPFAQYWCIDVGLLSRAASNKVGADGVGLKSPKVTTIAAVVVRISKTSQKMRQYTSSLYCCAFGAPEP